MRSPCTARAVAAIGKSKLCSIRRRSGEITCQRTSVSAASRRSQIRPSAAMSASDTGEKKAGALSESRMALRTTSRDALVTNPPREKEDRRSSSTARSMSFASTRMGRYANDRLTRVPFRRKTVIENESVRADPASRRSTRNVLPSRGDPATNGKSAKGAVIVIRPPGYTIRIPDDCCAYLAKVLIRRDVVPSATSSSIPDAPLERIATSVSPGRSTR